MPLTSLAVNALGLVTICLVALLIVLGLFCIIYILYFRAHVQSSSFVRLGYFNGPWLVRIAFILFGICWGAGEVVRLSLFRQEGRFSHILGRKWQEDMCKLYILLNLGFTEPCLFLTMSFLLRASLKWRGPGIQHHKWNIKTAGYVLLYCLPIFFLDLIVVMVAPKLQHGKSKLLHKLPETFTSSYSPLTVSGRSVIACTYPVLCTILHGLFSIVVTIYLLLLGRRMVLSVINRGLQKRVYILIIMVSGFLPLRIILIGFSVLARHERFLFEALAFSGFLMLLSCVVMGILILVYLPVADSLALNRAGLSPGLWGAVVGGGTSCTSPEDHTYFLSLIAANPSHVETSTGTSVGRNSDASTKRGSVSFRTMIKDEATSGGVYEEMDTFSPGFRPLIASPPGSPVHLPPLSSL